MGTKVDLSSIEKVFIFKEMVDVICRDEVRRYCKIPYKNHRRGCPKFGKHRDCPPKADNFSDIYGSKVVVIGVRFDFETYLRLRREAHLDWSETAIRNPRHWQGHLKSALKGFVGSLLLPDADEVVWNPEAMGVDLFETCRLVGIELERNPEKYVYRIALVARRK